MNATAIAQHLNIAADAIVKIEEWAQVLWVKFVGGCKFVSKKVIKMTSFPFINKPMPESVKAQTVHQVFVKIGNQKYVVKYYSNEGSNRAWNKLKNEVKAQSRWNGEIWIAKCDYQEFCQDFRLTCCVIEEA